MPKQRKPLPPGPRCTNTGGDTETAPFREREPGYDPEASGSVTRTCLLRCIHSLTDLGGGGSLGPNHEASHGAFFLAGLRFAWLAEPRLETPLWLSRAELGPGTCNVVHPALSRRTPIPMIKALRLFRMPDLRPCGRDSMRGLPLGAESSEGSFRPTGVSQIRDVVSRPILARPSSPRYSFIRGHRFGGFIRAPTVGELPRGSCPRSKHQEGQSQQTSHDRGP